MERKFAKHKRAIQNWKNETNIPGSEIPRKSDTGLTAYFVTLFILNNGFLRSLVLRKSWATIFAQYKISIRISKIIP